VGDRIAKAVELRIAFQRMDAIPEGFSVPEGRVKPWGTGHAVLAAKDFVDGAFAAINADDFYGADAYRAIYNFLTTKADSQNHAMVGYRLDNTLTDYGTVARGVCKVENGKLLEIVENKQIEKSGDGAQSILEDGSRVFLRGDTTVSMSIWGFGGSMMDELEARFESFHRDAVPLNLLKSEYLLPSVCNELLQEGKARFSVLPTSAKWCGVTYAQDMPAVQATLKALRDNGEYPDRLF
jgi:NDP-sugar pyrophosphorylase family protein